MDFQLNQTDALSNRALSPQLLDYSNKLSAVAKLNGVSVNPPSMEVVAAFSNLPTNIQNRILKIFKVTCDVNFNYRSLFNSTLENLALEISLMTSALNEFDLELKDKDFLEKIDKDDVIEVYNSEGVQVYRSWNFFKFCSYSLEELLVYDWHALYERPQSIVKALFELAPRLFTPDATTMSYDLKEYVLIERYNGKKDVFTVKMKLASPLVDRKTGQITAFISTSQIKKADAESSNLGFI